MGNKYGIPGNVIFSEEISIGEYFADVKIGNDSTQKAVYIEIHGDGLRVGVTAYGKPSLVPLEKFDWREERILISNWTERSRIDFSEQMEKDNLPERKLIKFY